MQNYRDPPPYPGHSKQVIFASFVNTLFKIDLLFSLVLIFVLFFKTATE